jgi:DNA-binding beta-propeller fold protein YncE
VRRTTNDMQIGGNLTKEFAVSHGFDGAMFVHLLTWIGLPMLFMLFVLFLTAVFKYPGDVPLPWRELLLIVLIAFITTNALVMMERRSFVKEAGQEPFAADPNAVAQTENGTYNNNWILAVWAAGILITGIAVVTRVFTNWWDFLNRQPIFDVLIVIATMIIPWAAAYPLFRAGYNLEDYNSFSKEGRDTLNASIEIIIPFFMISASVGLAWNWKRWLPAAAIFLGLFAFFFTTVFSNQYGLVTGMIGSLGYWLAQQGVRRGSQPQYYYVLTQLPVYEFLPMIGASLAGIVGLTSLWGWRRERTIAAIRARYAAEVDPVRPAFVQPEDVDEEPEAADSVALETLVSHGQRTEVIPPPDFGDEEAGVDPDTQPVSTIRFLDVPPRLARPFSVEEEAAQRAANPEWLGAFPFLALAGWWSIAILLGLTVAGEKMPWLTTHLTVPLILVTGWWLGRVAGKIPWRALNVSEWVVLLVALPLAFVAFGQVILGFWGAHPPLGGRDVTSLLSSGNWLAALMIFLGTLYVIGRFGERLGWMQLGRMAILSGAVILAVLTARVAYMASFINYDYATEYLVYAHAGPAVKTVLDEVNHIAEITNEGTGMRIVFDDESSWPFSWYFRDFTNYALLRGEAGSVDPTQLDGARVVVVGNKKAGDVRRILGDRYYEFDYIRLWWPMQEYFGLTYGRVANVFSTADNNIAARYYRQGIWDIWWNRDYSTYGRAMCIDSKQYRCDQEAQYGTTDQEHEQYRKACEAAVVNECAIDDRFAVNKWPVSDRLYFFVDKEIAAQVWDAGIGSSTVNIREPEYPEDTVYRDINAETTLGAMAGMTQPRGIVLDADGNVYVADTGGSRVVKLNPDGELVQVIAEQGKVSGDTGLREPWGLDIGPDGNLYIADTWNNRVAVYTTDGEFVRAWGHEGRPFDDPSVDAMWGPRDLKVGPDGNVYVADTGGKRIRVYSPEGDWVRDIGSGGSALGQLDEPVGLAFNPVSGDLYVAEAWNRRIQVFSADGVPLRVFTVNMWFNNRQSYNRPYLAVSPDGTLIYVTDMDDRHRIVAYDLSGQPMFSFNQPDNLEQGLLGVRNPAGLAVDATGRLYVVDADQSKVYVFPPSEVAGSVLPVPQSDQPSVPKSDQGGAPINLSPTNDAGGQG